MPVWIDSRRIAALCNPFTLSPWGDPVCTADVAQAIITGRLVADPGGADHAGRIAYLVQHEASDPIQLDIAVPGLGDSGLWPVEDGNHRLAAAIFAKRPVWFSVCGCLDYAARLFGVDCEAPVPNHRMRP